MDLIPPQRTPCGSAMLFMFYLSVVLWSDPASCIKVTTLEKINAVEGDTVTLSCQFTSTQRTTSLISVDWSFRPQSGGPAHVFFHFATVAYPQLDGHFKGRVKWYGDPSRGDASIRLLNASLNDNGTYSCAVRNPPDFQGPPSSTVLTVSLRKMTVHFSDIAMLTFFILVPSALIAIVLLGRILCPCCSPPVKSAHFSHHSPIEVTDGEEMLAYSTECAYHEPSSQRKSAMCCEISMEDSDEECQRYFEKHPEQIQAESHC